MPPMKKTCFSYLMCYMIASEYAWLQEVIWELFHHLVVDLHIYTICVKCKCGSKTFSTTEWINDKKMSRVSSCVITEYQ